MSDSFPFPGAFGSSDEPPVYIQLALEFMGLADPTWREWKEHLRPLLIKSVIPFALVGKPFSPFEGANARDLNRAYEACLATWRTSELWQSLKSSLKEHFRENGPPTITRAICVGLGNLAAEGNRRQYNTRHLYQLCFFVTMSELVDNSRADKKEPFLLYAQEPIFNEVDKDFLKSIDICVVDDPDAWYLVSKDTLAFGIHMPWMITWSLMIRNPGMLVGTEMQHMKSRPSFLSTSIAPFENDYQEIAIRPESKEEVQAFKASLRLTSMFLQKKRDV